MSKMFNKLFIPIAFIITLAVAFLSISSFRTQNNQLTQSSYTKLEMEQQQILSNVNQLIDNYTNVAKTLAHSDAIVNHDADMPQASLDAMNLYLSNIPLLNNVVLIDGPIVHFDARGAFSKKNLDVSARPYYTSMKNNPSLETFLNPPSKAPANGKPVVTLIARSTDALTNDVRAVMFPINIHNYIVDKVYPLITDESIHVIFADGAGNIIGSKDEDQIFNEEFILSSIQPTLYENMISTHSGREEGQFFGIDAFLVYDYVESMDTYVILYKSTEELKTLSQQNLINSLISIAGIILISGLIIYFFVKRITSPLHTLADYSKELAVGNFTIEFDSAIVNRSDEIGTLAHSYLDLKNQLSEIIGKIASVANTLSEYTETMVMDSKKMVEMTNNISTAIDQISKGAVSQADQTSTGVIQVNGLIDKTKMQEDNIHAINENFERIHSNVELGIQEILQLSSFSVQNQDMMNQIKSFVKQTNSSVQGISDASRLINEVADQTNLLALNAAIEAARAGESGRGFAVVADEIRKLAEQSSKTTQQIDAKIDLLLDASKSSVEAVEKGERLSVEQREKSDIVKENYDQINGVVVDSQKVIDIMTEYSNTIKEADISINTIMAELSAISEENAASTEEISATTSDQHSRQVQISQKMSELGALSQELKSMIGKFRI